MGNKCRVKGCTTNYQNYDSGAVFKLPKEPEIRQRWIKFLNRNDVDKLKGVFVCEKHFEDKFLNKNQTRTCLNKSMLPVPTLQSKEDNCGSAICTNLKLRKPPTERIFQSDQFEQFKHHDSISDFNEINEFLLKILPEKFNFSKNEDCAIFYKLETSYFSVPEVTYCLKINKNLNVQLFYKGSPLSLPAWFTKGRNAKLTSKNMLQNFIPYIKKEVEEHESVLEEIHKIKYQTRPMYSANLLRYALSLRYTSLSTYKVLLEQIKLPSISFLRKITSGKIDVMASAEALKNNKSISDDVILMFDEVYLQKCEEYVSGETFGADENGELYKGMVCFMIVGLKSNIPYIIKTVPEKEIRGEWLKDEIIHSLTILQEKAFNVRGIICDNHASNVSAYKKLLNTYGNSDEDLAIEFNHQKIYLFFDVVHLLKNIRNNLLNRKRFLFPPFWFDKFSDPINVPGGEISWKLFHDVFEKDLNLQANLKAAPKLSAKVLHPGNSKQSAPVALALFHPSTSASIKHYFPEKIDSAEFLNLIYAWWTISNAKTKFNSAFRLGDAAVLGDNKPQFLRAFADWIEVWDNEKMGNTEKFTLSTQTSHALRHTLRCQASLIEDLLHDGYDFILTAKFQSDPIEKRFGQYRQMSGGRFLISAKDVMGSEKILKIKSLIREGFNIDGKIILKEDNSSNIQNLLSSIKNMLDDRNSIRLDENSKEVSDNIAGYIAHKAMKYCNGCCQEYLIDQFHSANQDNYLSKLSRGGLQVPSEGLSAFVSQGFALLDASSSIIQSSPLPSRYAAENVLREFLTERVVECEMHNKLLVSKIIRIISNIFLNNKRKKSTDSVVKDKVVAFKRSKREKNYIP